jgi:hypothetical protein
VVVPVEVVPLLVVVESAACPSVLVPPVVPSVPVVPPLEPVVLPVVEVVVEVIGVVAGELSPDSSPQAVRAKDARTARATCMKGERSYMVEQHSHRPTHPATSMLATLI